MRIIISGGTGMIGQQLVPELAALGHEVYVLTRNVADKSNLFVPSVQFAQWDAISSTGWGHLINKDTVLINLAGENVANWRWTLTHKRIVLRSRLDATRAMVEAINQASEKPRALLQASAVGYYGSRGQLSIGEITPAGDGWRAEVCKLWEAESDPVLDAGVRRVLLRIGIVIDVSGGALPPFLLGALFMGGRLGGGDQWVPWVHNADVAGAIIHLLNDETVEGAVNVTSPAPVTNEEFFQAIGRVRRWPTFIPVPAWALQLALGEMATTVLDSQRVYPALLQERGYNFRFAHLDDALRHILKR